MKRLPKKDCNYLGAVWFILGLIQMFFESKLHSVEGSVFVLILALICFTMSAFFFWKAYMMDRKKGRSIGFIDIVSHNEKRISPIEKREYLENTYPGLPRYIQSEMFYRHFTVPKGFVFDKKHLLTSCRRVVYPRSVVTLICPNEIKRDNYVTHNDLFVLFLFRHNLPYSQYKPSAFARDIISMEEAGTPYEITF